MLGFVIRGRILWLSLLAGGAGAGVIAGCGSQSSSLFFPDATTGPTGPTGPSKKDSGTTKLHGSSDASACGGASTDQEGCPCSLGQTVACYTGPAGTLGVGSCQAGAQRCQASGEFPAFGVCMGEVLPSSATSCVALPDAAPPPPPPPKDAGMDSSNALAVVGQPCTTGQVQNSTMTYPCSGGIGCGCSATSCTCSCGSSGTDAGMSMGAVLFCDSAGVWDEFPSGGCTPSACMACMQTNCETTVTGDAGAACTANLQKAINWLAACGPDRANYFQTLGAGCPSGALQQVESCKDSECLGTGVCSFW